MAGRYGMLALVKEAGTTLPSAGIVLLLRILIPTPRETTCALDRAIDLSTEGPDIFIILAFKSVWIYLHMAYNPVPWMMK
jgi:hypothetical protein